MSDDAARDQLFRKPVVYALPDMDSVTVTRDREFVVSGGRVLTMDIYYPPAPSATLRPAIFIPSAYPDLGFEARLGLRFKDIGWASSCARLAAASGVIAITATNVEPAVDAAATLDHVRQHAAALGIDASRLGLWACSGHGPLALWLLMENAATPLRCAVLSYAYTLDPDGQFGIAATGRQFGFVVPVSGKSVADLPEATAIFLARAGQDEFAHLNDAMDHLTQAGLKENRSITLVNNRDGRHAFDILEDTDISREVVKSILAFIVFHLDANER